MKMTIDLDDDTELTFDRYQKLATATCAVLPIKTGAALFVRESVLVHVGMMTRLTLGRLKNFARYGTLDRPGGLQSLQL